jgi:16S rRNA (cytosine1402-N4)-methyltransferase
MGKSANLNYHVPVLLQEVLDGLAIEGATTAGAPTTAGAHYLDATVGDGGHAKAILEATSPDGVLLGLDRDPDAVERAALRLADFDSRVVLVHADYGHLKIVAEEQGFVPLDGVLFDLGFSSWQIEDPTRGFSFQADGPLDMRFDTTEASVTAAGLVNEASENELIRIIRKYGEEPHSRQIAQAIVAARPIQGTVHLASVITDAVIAGAARRERQRLHPATRTFQALRIAVNQELRRLRDALPQAVSGLRPGGRLAVITFHSLEDRIVKRFMRKEARECICPPEAPICTCDHKATLRVITRKPIRPSDQEVQRNPRSRSAKLRVAERLDIQR